VGRLARALGRPYRTVWGWIAESVAAGDLPDWRTPGGQRRVPADLAERIVRGEWSPESERRAA
jgi:hypothetical protein